MISEGSNSIEAGLLKGGKLKGNSVVVDEEELTMFLFSIVIVTHHSLTQLKNFFDGLRGTTYLYTTKPLCEIVISTNGKQLL